MPVMQASRSIDRLSFDECLNFFSFDSYSHVIGSQSIVSSFFFDPHIRESNIIFTYSHNSRSLKCTALRTMDRWHLPRLLRVYVYIGFSILSRWCIRSIPIQQVCPARLAFHSPNCSQEDQSNRHDLICVHWFI